MDKGECQPLGLPEVSTCAKRQSFGEPPVLRGGACAVKLNGGVRGTWMTGRMRPRPSTPGYPSESTVAVGVPREAVKFESAVAFGAPREPVAAESTGAFGVPCRAVDSESTVALGAAREAVDSGRLTLCRRNWPESTVALGAPQK